MATTNIELPELKESLAEWQKCKDYSDKWNDLKLAAEVEVLDILKAQGVELPETGTLRLNGKLEVAFNKTRKFVQASVAALVTVNPTMIGTLFKQEYKEVNRAINAYVQAAHHDHAALVATYSEAPRKPAFKRV